MANIESIEKFAKPFDPSDGVLSDEEKLRAATDFSQLVDDLFLANITDVTVGKDDVSFPPMGIDIRAPDGRGWVSSTIKFMIMIDKDGEKKIQIRENELPFQWKTTIRERTTVYRASLDAKEVKRTDERVTREVKFAAEGAEPSRSTEEDIIEGLKRLVESAENYALEADMGYNNQAVDSEEVAQLRALILK